MKEKNNEILLILFECLLAILAFVIDNNTTKILLFILIFYSSYIFKKINPTMLLFSISNAVNFEAGGIATLLITLPAYLNLHTFKNLKNKKNLLIFSILIFIVTLSYLFGINPQFKSVLLFIRCILMLLTLMNSDISENEFKTYVFFKFLIILFILIYQFKTNTISFYWGRLALNGNVRELANAIAIPTFVFGISLLEDKQRILRKIVSLSFFGICLFVLLATSSRGVLFSTFIAIILFYLMTNSKLTFKKVITMTFVFILVFYIINYISSLDIFKVDRILVDETGGLNGRTTIWAQYLKYQFSSIKTALFGFGPGDVRRLRISSFYSHSLFLDWLFSFGILGFVYIILFLWRLFVKLLSTKNKFYISLLILALFLFSTHGIITDTLFYILIGSSFWAIKNNEKNNGGGHCEKKI